MTRATAVALAWSTAVAGALALVFAGNTGTTLTGSGFSPLFVGLALAVVTDASVGAVLTIRRRGNLVGLLLIVAANLLAITILVFVSGAVLTEQRGRQDLVAGLVALIGVLGFVPTLIIAGPLLALIFPNGRLPGHGWRWPVAGIIVATSKSRQRSSCVLGRSVAASPTTRSE